MLNPLKSIVLTTWYVLRLSNNFFCFDELFYVEAKQF